ncbi:MAG: hypothetical protein WBZ33_13620 [Thermoactinomyces sp.]
MDFITAVLLISITVILHYQILVLILLGFIIYHAIKTDWQTMYKTVLAYLFSVSLVIGVPYGIVKIMVPEANGAEQAIVKSLR